MTRPTAKPLYQLRGKRRQRPVKPEFAMTGILVGIALGWTVGFGLELIYRKKGSLMAAVSVAGLLLGAAFEAIRFRWRMHRFRVCHQPNPRPFL